MNADNYGDTDVCGYVYIVVVLIMVVLLLLLRLYCHLY